MSKTTDTFCKIISGRKYVFFFWHHSMLSIMEHSIFLPQILCMACLFYSKKKKRFLRVAPTSESSFSNQWYEAIPFHPIKLSICCKRMCSYLHSPWSCCTDTKCISKLSLFFWAVRTWFMVGYSPWRLKESEITEWLSTHTSEPDCQCGRHGFNPWFGKIPGEGNGNPL